MEVNLLAEGFKFMILGMGTVFLFLILLIYVLNLQAQLIQKYFPTNANATTSSQPETSSEPKKDDKKLVAAIIGAITAYKKG